MVAPERIELSLPRGKHDFESSASTNSATEPLFIEKVFKQPTIPDVRGQELALLEQFNNLIN